MLKADGSRKRKPLINRTKCTSAGCVLNCGQDIPFFKEVLIMATTCDACGHRDNEVKSGTGVADEGTRIELRLTDTSDLTRDILKVNAQNLI